MRVASGEDEMPVVSSLDHPLTRRSYTSLPGQRVSACTCKGEDHPGPVNTKGRGAPEIDAIEVCLLLPSKHSLLPLDLFL